MGTATLAVAVQAKSIINQGGRVDEYLSTVEAAKRLRVSRSTIVRWIREGFFPNARQKNPNLETSPYEIPISDIEEFLRGGEKDQ